MIVINDEESGETFYFTYVKVTEDKFHVDSHVLFTAQYREVISIELIDIDSVIE